MSRWRGLGQIFDIARDGLPAGCVGWAQSPQPVVFDDRVRIYFSTRTADASGKYVSQMAYVDMTKDLSRVIAVADRPVLGPAALGAFDEHGVFPMQVIRNGEELWGYTCGWSRRVSVSVETAIGLAISRDGGETFERIGDGPVLGPSPLEPFLVGDGHVQRIDDVFHMWYIFGTAWERPTPEAVAERTYKIGHATSTDGIAWVKDEGRAIIPDLIGAAESQALPSVLPARADVPHRAHHQMVFCYRESVDFRTGSGRGYRLGQAWSDDLGTWQRDDQMIEFTPTADGWDSQMQCYPQIFECEGQTYLLYNGNEFGRHGFGAAVWEP